MIGTIFITIFSRYFWLILLLLPSITLIATSIAFGQARKTNRTSAAKPKTVQQTKQSANKTVDTAELRTVRIRKWGIESLSLPAGIAERVELTKLPNDNGVPSTYYYFSWYWDTPPTSRKMRSFGMSISVTAWDADFPKVRSLKPEEATSENLLRLDLLEDERTKRESVIPIEEVSYLELNGLRGVFTRAGYLTDKKLSELVGILIVTTRIKHRKLKSL